eukprot:7115179-Prymnesium_polylepis.1
MTGGDATVLASGRSCGVPHEACAVGSERWPRATVKEREDDAVEKIKHTKLGHGGLGRGNFHLQRHAWKAAVDGVCGRIRQVASHQVGTRARSYVHTG